MPWCGIWGTASGSYWWILPLVGLVFMGVMWFACSRGSGCMGRRRYSTPEVTDLRDEVEKLKDVVRGLKGT